MTIDNKQNKKKKKNVHPINISHQTLNLPKAAEHDASDFENVKLSEHVKFTITISGYQVLQMGDFLRGVGGSVIAVGQWLQWGIDGPMIVIQDLKIEKQGSEDMGQAEKQIARDAGLKQWQCLKCEKTTYCEYDPSYDIKCKCGSDSWRELLEYE